jgi:regulator of protease activity HflC (stomatin/prohibitin superfamily)
MEIILGLAVLTGFIVLTGLRQVNEFDRLVIFRLGKITGTRGPGLQLVLPLIERSQKVDTRTITMPIPVQEAISRDNVTLRVAAVCFYQIVDPVKSVSKVEDAVQATGQVAQTTLRTIVGQYELDEILSDRDRVNQKLSAIIDRQTEAWGIKVTSVEVKDVEIPNNMQRAMARQAEAERERRAKVVAAEGEVQAAHKLREAAEIISSQPGALQLRQLQTMVEIATEAKSTLLMPVPMEFLVDKLSGVLSGEESLESLSGQSTKAQTIDVRSKETT